MAGEVDDDIDFTFEQNTEVYGSCATSLEGEMWVLGGEQQQRQVYITKVSQKKIIYAKILKMSKVLDCKLTSVGELPFNYSYGGCNSFDFGILLCFSWPDETAKDCHS